MQFFRILKVTWFILRFRKKQKKFNDHFINKFLSSFEKQYQSKINPATFGRIKGFYAHAVPLTCAAFASIYKRELSSQERENASLAAIITPIIDDFTDKYGLSIKQLDYLLAFPGQHVPRNLEEAIVRNILDQLVNKVANPNDTIKEFNRTLAAQHWSEKQLNQTLPEAEILKITYEKGGASLLLLHYMITETPDEQMINVINHVGGTLQLCNDIFDIHKDFQDGVKTVPTCCGDFVKLEKFYFAECVKFNQMALGSNENNKDLGIFITFFTMLLGRGMVALNKLSKLQQKLGGGPLPIQQIERRELICDMEKPANLVSAMKYTQRIMKTA